MLLNKIIHIYRKYSKLSPSAARETWYLVNTLLNIRQISAGEIVETELATHEMFTAMTPARLIFPRNGLLEKPGTFWTRYQTLEVFLLPISLKQHEPRTHCLQLKCPRNGLLEKPGTRDTARCVVREKPFSYHMDVVMADKHKLSFENLVLRTCLPVGKL